jgi:hypothetical protein
VIPRRLIYNCRRFGTLYLFHLPRQKVQSDAVGAREGVFICETKHYDCYKVVTFDSSLLGCYTESMGKYFLMV